MTVLRRRWRRRCARGTAVTAHTHVLPPRAGRGGLRPTRRLKNAPRPVELRRAERNRAGRGTGHRRTAPAQLCSPVAARARAPQLSSTFARSSCVRVCVFITYTYRRPRWPRLFHDRRPPPCKLPLSFLTATAPSRPGVSSGLLFSRAFSESKVIATVNRSFRPRVKATIL